MKCTSKGHIKVSLFYDAELKSIKTVVEDTGIGISEEKKK